MNLNWNGVMILIQKMTKKWLNCPELAAPKRVNKLQFKIHQMALIMMRKMRNLTKPKVTVYILGERLLPLLLNLFKLVYDSFEQSNMHRTLDFCLKHPERN